MTTLVMAKLHHNDYNDNGRKLSKSDNPNSRATKTSILRFCDFYLTYPGDRCVMVQDLPAVAELDHHNYNYD